MNKVIEDINKDKEEHNKRMQNAIINKKRKKKKNIRLEKLLKKKIRKILNKKI